MIFLVEVDLLLRSKICSTEATKQIKTDTDNILTVDRLALN
jgi:hypothetical protein